MIQSSITSNEDSSSSSGERHIVSSSSSSSDNEAVGGSAVPPTPPNNISEETVYDFYTQQLYPALVSSLPILLKRIGDDSKYLAITTVKKFITFLLPKWNSQEPLYGYNTPELPAFVVEFWKNHTANLNNNIKSPSSIADFMIRNFDTNADGHISIQEMSEIIKHWPSTYVNQHHHVLLTMGQQTKESWSTWFTREWPLMDWKIGVFLWKTFGGILLLLAVLSITPGPTHGFSAKILRWPILGLTYFLVGVELMVYIVIRTSIRLAEDLIARPKHRTLRNNMAKAKTYQEWHTFASELDKSQKREKWLSQVDDHTSHRYNWGFIRELIRDMRQARSKKDSLLALAVIQQCTRKNVGGVMSEDLFSYSNTGEPKLIVSEFVNELCLTLRWITEEASHLPILDDEATVNMTVHESIIFKENQQKYTNQYQNQMNNENNKLLQSLIQATLGLVFNSSGGNNNNGNNNPENDENRYGIRDVTNNNTKNKDRVVDPNAKTASSTSNPSENNSSSNTSFGNSIPKSIVASLKHQNSAESEMLSAVHRKEVLSFLKRARQAYGRTALCLSGGAMMGLYHFGHVLGLLELGLLPDIISGTSGGSVVGAIVCTRTDDELEHDLNPDVLIKHLKCFERPWKVRLQSVLENGNLFSFDEWMKLIKWFTCGQTTFEEAYKKTGRIFCVTLSSTTKKAPPVLLNYLTAPNVTIASAVIASAAVPGFVPPVRLQYKDKHGVVRSQEGETYFDGSISQDIPINGLAEMFNCQFYIACQCNPHIVPFFYNHRGGVGRPSRWSNGTQEDSWRGGFLLSALEMYLKNDMKAKMRFLNDLEAAVGFTSTMMTQEYEGSTTIVPQVSVWDYFKLFSDPTREELLRYFQRGTVAAYEHIAMIKLHYSVADTLDECIHKLDVGNKEREAIFRRRHPKSILFVQGHNKPTTRQALTFSPFRRVPSNPSHDSSAKASNVHHIRGTDSLSTHTESDDEDEFEREWVTNGVSRN